MDESYSDSDVTLSPSQILERLEVLRKLQLLQRGKLQKQSLLYHDSPQRTSSITEIVSHFSNSTSYNTFRSLLQSSELSNEIHSISEPICLNLSRKNDIQNVIEGVSVLNLSEASESHNVASSKSSAKLDNEKGDLDHSQQKSILTKKQISLDDMPILSPKKDFEALVTEKLKNEKTDSLISKISKSNKPFLKRGEGMARFGLPKNKLVIQNTKSLPWRKKKTNHSANNKDIISNKDKEYKLENNNMQGEKMFQEKVVKVTNISPLKSFLLPKINDSKTQKENMETNKGDVRDNGDSKQPDIPDNSVEKSSFENDSNPLKNAKQPFVSAKEKTWASVLTKEQDDFLRQLKQSHYYKNFISPVKSIVSDISGDENHLKLSRDKEAAEQNLFDLLENKASHESFNINNSFLNKFLKQSNMEYSGESTPIIMQKCLSRNPNLMNLLPNIQKNESSCTDAASCYSECSDCNDTHSFVSDCSCQTTSQVSVQTAKSKEGLLKKTLSLKQNKEETASDNDNKSQDNEVLNKNMVEMNAKLVATSDLLKDRLHELEDEIETFRKENTNLKKMKDDIELERQKFYEEKTLFEQKFNEEKILSEYYLAEEKEKLSKQKQTYERYVRDMRGRLNKKEKDEIINLKKEINDLREEIRAKDAKSTSMIARLRNQLKIIEKEKKNLDDVVEKLKKENRRIQHSNDITRRLTNLKYLEQINKKLTNMTSKDAQSDIVCDSDIKYKAYEIERQSRGRKKPLQKSVIRPRAKSVPNLKVTSRYAKYFSQKDSLSEREKNESFSNNIVQAHSYSSNNDLPNSEDENIFDNCRNKTSDSEDDNNLEKMYNERFKSISPSTNRNSIHSLSRSRESLNHSENNNDFFLKKTTQHLSKSSISPKSNFDPSFHSIQGNLNHKNSSVHNSNERKSPASNYFEICDISSNYQRTKSPVSILGNRSSCSQKSGTIVKKATYHDSRMMPSPEPTVSKTSLSRTNLNPTEIRKPDGSKEVRFPNGNVKIISADGKYSKFVYYNGDIKENFLNEGRIKYYYSETKTYHTTHPDGLEVLEFPDGQVEKRYKDGSTEIRLPNGSIRYFDPKNEHVREEWRFPDGAALTISANGDQRIVFPNGQIEVHAKDHKRREFPDGTVKLIYNDGTAETRYASGRVRIKDKHGNLLMDSATRQ